MPLIHVSGPVHRIGETHMQEMNQVYRQLERPLAALFACRDHAKAIAEKQRELLFRNHADTHPIQRKENHHD